MTLFCAPLPQEHWHQTELPNAVTMKLKQRRNRKTIHTDVMNYTLMIVRVNNGCSCISNLIYKCYDGPDLNVPPA